MYVHHYLEHLEKGHIEAAMDEVLELSSLYRDAVKKEQSSIQLPEAIVR
jgi:hypothetical protein